MRFICAGKLRIITSNRISKLCPHVKGLHHALSTNCTTDGLEKFTYYVLLRGVSFISPRDSVETRNLRGGFTIAKEKISHADSLLSPAPLLRGWFNCLLVRRWRSKKQQINQPTAKTQGKFSRLQCTVNAPFRAVRDRHIQTTGQATQAPGRQTRQTDRQTD